MNSTSIHIYSKASDHPYMWTRNPMGVLALCISLFLTLVGAISSGPVNADTTAMASITPSYFPGYFRGKAYAAYADAKVGPITATIGRVALINCPCYGTLGRTRSHTLNAVSLGDGAVLQLGVASSTSYTRKTATAAVVRNASTITGLRLFDGVITADAITAQANTAANSTAARSNAIGSSFVNLSVAGQPVASNVGPDTKIDLAGIGHVLLKHSQKSGNGLYSSAIIVEMLSIVVSEANSLGLPVGSKIVIGHAMSGYARNRSDTFPEASLGGQAYLASGRAEVASALDTIGKPAYVSVGCLGTKGITRTNTATNLNISGVISTGAGETTARGEMTATGGNAKTTATVAQVKLLSGLSLGGLVSADAITVVAQDVYTNGTRTGSTDGTQFVNLKVAGVKLPDIITPNTRVDLPLIGYVILREETFPLNPNSRTARVAVNGIHIHVDRINLLGLPVGADIIVGHADSKASQF